MSQTRASSLSFFGLALARRRRGCSSASSSGLAAVAVVGLVVDDDDVLASPRSRQTRLTISAGRLGEAVVVVVEPVSMFLVELAGLDLLAALEGVEVGDDDLGAA